MKRDEIIPNAGSTARDHLANERTFLAWVRTALGFVGLGVFIAKLVETSGWIAEIAGSALVAYGGVALVYSIVRYERSANLLQNGQFQVARRGPLVLGLVALLVAFTSFVMVLLWA